MNEKLEKLYNECKEELQKIGYNITRVGNKKKDLEKSNIEY